MPQQEGLLTFEDARVIFRNFVGRETKYNREGDRNFCVIVPPDIAQKLDQDGWNVKSLDPREDGDEPTFYIKVSISYKGRPPKIVLITSRTRTELGQEEIEMLDWADFKTVDLVVRPYNWTVGNSSGISAYLKTMYITIFEDDLELKYDNLEEDLPARAGRVEE